MTGAICRAVCSAVLGLAVTVGVAGAHVPECTRSTFPTYVDLGGCNGSGVVDPNVFFTVTIRDMGNVPVDNIVVWCSFDSDVRISDASPGFASCQCVEATTDLLGVATFHVQGAGRNTNGGASFTGATAAWFYLGYCGSSILCATAHVATYDENGGVTTRGVEITDLSAWGVDYANRMVPPVKRRSDFNHGGTVEIADLSYWARVFSSGQSRYSCGTLCP